MPYLSSIREIRYNLETIEKAIKKNADNPISAGFLTIFQSDIANLREKTAKTALREIESLEGYLYKIGDLMGKNNPLRKLKIQRILSKKREYNLVSEARSFKGFMPSLERPSEPKTSLSNEEKKKIREENEKKYKEKKEHLSNVINQVAERYDYYRIAGDGHCMYRASITVLLLEKIGTVKRVFEEIFKDGKYLKQDEYLLLNRALEALIAQKLQAIDILNDKKISDLFVKALRVLTALGLIKKVDEIKKSTGNRETRLSEMASIRFTIGDIDGDQANESIDDDNAPVVSVDDEYRVKRYCAKMVNMQRAAYGGDFEVGIIASIFGIHELAVDVEWIEKKILQNLEPSTYKIFHNGDHYSVLAPKPSADITAERADDCRGPLTPRGIASHS